MTDLSTLMGTDPAPATTEPAQVPGMPPPDAGTPGTHGVHPWDQSVPVDPNTGHLVEPDRPPSTGPDHLASQGFTTQKPWGTDNEQAIPINQRSAHDWTANRYTLQAGNVLQLAGRLRGKVSTIVWVPATSTLGVVISPDEGDVQQGAGITLNPGDSAEIPSEGPVWGGVIPGNATGGPVQVIVPYNPPGGGLGLSST